VAGWKVKVKPDSSVLHQASVEAKHSGDVDEDSDIEVMFPAPDEGPVNDLICFTVSLMPSQFPVLPFQLK